MKPDERSHSERMELELEDIRRLFDKAVDEEDNARVVSLARIIEQMERNLERARLREGTYMRRSEVIAYGEKIAAMLIDIVKPYVTPDQWAEIIGLLMDYEDKHYA